MQDLESCWGSAGCRSHRGAVNVYECRARLCAFAQMCVCVSAALRCCAAAVCAPSVHGVRTRTAARVCGQRCVVRSRVSPRGESATPRAAPATTQPPRASPCRSGPVPDVRDSVPVRVRWSAVGGTRPRLYCGRNPRRGAVKPGSGIFPSPPHLRPCPTAPTGRVKAVRGHRRPRPRLRCPSRISSPPHARAPQQGARGHRGVRGGTGCTGRTGCRDAGDDYGAVAGREGAAVRGR